MAAFTNRSVVNLTVSGEAIRSCPAGGSLAYDAHGAASGHAMCSGKVLEMTEVWPGVSISAMTSMPRWKMKRSIIPNGDRGRQTRVVGGENHSPRWHTGQYLRFEMECRPRQVNKPHWMKASRIQERQEGNFDCRRCANGKCLAFVNQVSIR